MAFGKSPPLVVLAITFTWPWVAQIFGYSGDSFDSSYDFAAPIGEAGQLRQLYYLARRASYFDQTFTPLLAGSHNDPKFATCNQPELRVTTRTNLTGGRHCVY